MPGALEGARVLEIAAIGPAPFGVMLLADMGAEVVRVDKVPAGKGMFVPEASMIGVARGRRSVCIDLKRPEGRELVLQLAEQADVLVEGFRPGVMERLGLGPDTVTARNPRIVYARMTGWGQEGPLSHTAGHDLNYAAVAGAVHPIGRKDAPPPPPLNLLADFAGGGCYMALGVLAALVERERSGQGQVIDAAMVDGVASLTAFFHGALAMGGWSLERESNLLDGGSPYYDCYETADGEYMAVGALEPQFYAELLERLELDPAGWPQHDTDRWPAYRRKLAGIFRSRTRSEWEKVFEGSDACVAPVLDLQEATEHPHLRARGTFRELFGMVQPSPAPRFSRTPGEPARPAPEFGQHTDEILSELGIDDERLSALRDADVVA